MVCKKTFVSMIILICAFSISGCSKGDKFEPPVVDITIGTTTNSHFAYITKVSTKNNATDDPQDILLKYTRQYTDLTYVGLNSTLQIKFEKEVPDSVTLVDYVLNSNLSEKVPLSREVPVIDNKVEYLLVTHPAEAFIEEHISQTSRVKRGIKLICKFKDVTCEYVFALRTNEQLSANQ